MLSIHKNILKKCTNLLLLNLILINDSVFFCLDSNISLNKKTPKIDGAFCEFYKKTYLLLFLDSLFSLRVSLRGFTVDPEFPLGVTV